MVSKRQVKGILSLFVASFVLPAVTCSPASGQDWSPWLGQITGVSQPTISAGADRHSGSQDDITFASGLELTDWLTVSANLESAWRNTNFDNSGHNTFLSQGDSRLEFWLPPGRDEFSWGPYVRFAGLTSDKSRAWENVWLAQPGYGLNVYPFSAADFRKENEGAAKILGPLRLFGEYNRMDYWGRTNMWRPNEQVRAGADYWKALHTNNTYMPWWAEVWSGLWWQSANEFDKDYDATIFANALRIGIRQPKAGIVSALSPYVLVESSLTDNRAFYWENRLLAGAGMRFAPLIDRYKDNSNWLTRLVAFAEYLHVAAYYRESAPSSVPDYDVRVGISLSIGEWYR